MPTNRDDTRPEFGLRQVINVSGTMTSLGASIVVPQAVDAVSAILGEFVEMIAPAADAEGLPTPIGEAHGLGAIPGRCSDDVKE